MRRSVYIAFFVLACGLGGMIGTGCADEPGPEAAAGAPQHTIDPRASYFLNAVQRAYGQGAYDIALALTDSVEQYAPDLADLSFARGLIYSTLNRFDEAEAAYRRVLALDPAYRSAWFNLGNNAFVQGRYREALGLYRKEKAAIEASPEADRRAAPAAYRGALSAVLLQVGRAYLKLGVADSARFAYQHALEVDSTNAQAYGWMSELSGQTGNLAEALAYARRALERDPGNPAYRYSVGAFLARMGRAEEAVGQLEAVAAQQPWHVGAHYNLGRALMALGHREAAQRYLEKTDTLQQRQTDITMAQFATFQYPGDPDRWLHLADLLRLAGRHAEARKAYDVARSLRGS